MTDISRRKLVAVTGTAALGAVAGCMGGDEDDTDNAGDDAGDDDNENPTDESDGNSDTDETGIDDDTEAEEDEPPKTELGEITVENLNSDAHTVDIIVEFDGEIEHWSTHELEASGDGATLERDWSTEPGSFRVTVRLDGGDFTTVTPAAWNNPSCLNLLVLVQRDGNITVAGVTDGGPCGSGDVDLEDAEDAEEEDGE